MQDFYYFFYFYYFSLALYNIGVIILDVMRMVNHNKTKGARVMELTNEYKCIGRDWADNCANYAKLNNGTVTVQTLYRYGKPVIKTMTVEKYNDWKNYCEETLEWEAV